MKDNQSILLVDDEEVYLDVLARFLIKSGYEVDTANSGKQALELLGKNSFNLVITDMVMPEITGFELLKEVKTIFPETEVIMVTGYGEIESYIEAIKQGAFELLSKPIDIHKLMKTIEKVFS